MLKDYYWLAKPGIIYGNAIAAIAGYFLAAGTNVNFVTFLVMLVGLCLVIGSACVVNNVMDRDMDKKMKRTQWRGTANGKISVRAALIYAVALGVAGFGLLALTTWYAVIAAVVGVVFYVALYSPAKRQTVYAAVIGSVAGAVPPVVGYTAASNSFDTGALLLFIIMAIWQMPHFYAIAIFRMKDYAAASVPVLPRKIGMKNTKIQIAVYVAAYLIAALLLTVFGYTGYVYAVIMGVLSLVWLQKALRGFKAADDTKWARQLFHFSLYVLMTFCVTISLDMVLP
ncbi:MAG TPA: heme o synthase [Candidatus Saccharimonadales bacterium]|nr:heme o synthase [Candidatus Saccharimonadales bacterium]